ncbi:MAG: hypothetical protein ABFD98_03580 [Syntrophobacteraceae bacterium]
MRKAIPAILLLAALFAGCATTGPPSSKTLLDFLTDGATSKEDVLLQLGQASGTFESERILTYRIGKDDTGYFLLDRLNRPDLRGTWAMASHSLVLVFDENNILRRHSLVPVR